MVHNRLLKEYRELCDPTKSDPDIELALEDESDVFVWLAQLRGPADSPYEDGLFKLHIKCPPNYPLAPPKVSFVTPIFHPNVLFKTGEICLDILKPDSWTPAWTLQSVCRAVTALLSHPEADSPLNCDCGAPLSRPSSLSRPSPSPGLLPLPASGLCVPAGNLIRNGDMRGYRSMARMYTQTLAARAAAQ